METVSIWVVVPGSCHFDMMYSVSNVLSSKNMDCFFTPKSSLDSSANESILFGVRNSTLPDQLLLIGFRE